MVDRDMFFQAFGERYDDVLGEGRVGKAVEGCDHFGCGEEELMKLWRDTEGRGNVIKLGGGFYCGKFPPNYNTPQTQNPSQKPYYILNAFFLSMKSQYTKPNTSITVYEIEWDPDELSWADFRSKFIGCTDPSVAEKGSVRNLLYKGWKGFGLVGRPDKGTNGIHASASPLEGMSERCNWLGRSLNDDPLAKELKKFGITKKELVEWCKDPRMKIGCDDGEDDSDVPKWHEGGLFDAVEDLDVGDCLERLIAIKKLNK